MRISDWSSDVCSSDLRRRGDRARSATRCPMRLILASKSASRRAMLDAAGVPYEAVAANVDEEAVKIAMRAEKVARSEEHTSELQSLMRISYAVFCLKKNKKTL